MTNDFIPSIGDRGFYSLAAPFELRPGSIHTCKAIRKISDLHSDNVDVFERFYQPKGLTKDIFEEDQGRDAAIISLHEDSGAWVEVPSRYLLGYPNMSGIPYKEFGFAIGLPAFPVDTDFSNLEQLLKDAVMQTMGVECTVKKVGVSNPTLKDSTEHTLIRSERLLRSTAMTPSTLATVWRTRYEDLMFKFNQLVSGTNWS